MDTISTMNTDVNVIAGLGDRPNVTNSLTALLLKAKFDLAAGYLKSYINGTIVAAVNALIAHANNMANPHGVTASQVGAATTADFIAHTSSTANPHKVTKAQVELGNVPNVATNDQTPTYTEASTLAALSSGGLLSMEFGKLSKAVSSLISHLANTSNPHSVTGTQVISPLSVISAPASNDRLAGYDASGSAAGYFPYSNLGGAVLWQNSSPSASFAAQSITLNSSDYDMLEMFFKSDTETNEIMSVRTPKGYGAIATKAGPYSSMAAAYYRHVTYNSATSLSIGDCLIAKTTETITGNTSMIPLCVVGYKTGLSL